MPNVSKSGSLSLLEPSGPVQTCNGIALNSSIHPLTCFNEPGYATYFDACALRNRTEAESIQLLDLAPVNLHARQILRFIQKFFNHFKQRSTEYCNELAIKVNPYPTAFPYGNGMVLHFYQQQESSTTKTVHKVINRGLKAYV